MTPRGHFLWSDNNSGISQCHLIHSTVGFMPLHITEHTFPLHCHPPNSSNIISRLLIGKDLIHNCLNPCVIPHCVHVCFFCLFLVLNYKRLIHRKAYILFIYYSFLIYHYIIYIVFLMWAKTFHFQGNKLYPRAHSPTLSYTNDCSWRSYRSFFFLFLSMINYFFFCLWNERDFLRNECTQAGTTTLSPHCNEKEKKKNTHQTVTSMPRYDPKLNFCETFHPKRS